MIATKQLETKIGDLFKGAPPLPENAKKSLVNAWPWIALIFGVLQLLAAWGLWGLTRYVDRLNDVTNTLSMYYTGRAAGMSSLDKTIIYLALIVLVVDAVILLMAYPELKKKSKAGWDLLFLGSLINLAYAVVSIFIDDRGFGSFIFSLLGSAIGFYLLFQVKDHYTHKSKS